MSTDNKSLTKKERDKLAIQILEKHIAKIDEKIEKIDSIEISANEDPNGIHLVVSNDVLNKGEYKLTPDEVEHLKYLDQTSSWASKALPSSDRLVGFDLFDDAGKIKAKDYYQDQLFKRKRELEDLKTQIEGNNDQVVYCDREIDQFKDSRTKDIIRLSNTKYVRAQFMYQGENQPVADSYVLYWKYKKGTNKLASVIPGSRIMTSVGIAKTDSNGYLISTPTFQDKDGDQYAQLYFNKTSGELIITPKKDALTAKTADYNVTPEQAKDSNESLLNEGKRPDLTRLTSTNPIEAMAKNFSIEFNTKMFAEIDQELKTDGWIEITKDGSEKSIAFFEEGYEYGFMLCPPDLGACKLPNLAELPKLSLERESGSVKPAFKTVVTNEQKIELFCTLRQWTHRLNVETEELSNIEAAKQKTMMGHLQNITTLQSMASLAKNTCKFPYQGKGNGFEKLMELDIEIGELTAKKDKEKGLPELDIEITRQLSIKTKEREELLTKLAKDKTNIAEYEELKRLDQEQPKLLAQLASASTDEEKEVYELLLDAHKNQYTYLINKISENIENNAMQDEKVIEYSIPNAYGYTVHEKSRIKTHPVKNLIENIDACSAAINNYAQKTAANSLYLAPLYNNPQSFLLSCERTTTMVARRFLQLTENELLKTEVMQYLKSQPKKDNIEKAISEITFPIPSGELKADYHAEYLYTVLQHGFTLIGKTSLAEECFEKQISGSIEKFIKNTYNAEMHEALGQALEAQAKLEFGLSRSRKFSLSDSTLAGLEKNSQNLTVLVDDLSKETKSPPATELLPLIFEFLQDSKELAGLTINNAPGTPCLLQMFVDGFEMLIASKMVGASDQSRAKLIQLTAGIMNFFKGGFFNKKAYKELAAALAKGMNYSKTTTPLRQVIKEGFLQDTLWKKHLGVYRLQLGATVMMKATFCFVSVVNIWDTFHEIAKQNDSNDSDLEKTRTILRLNACLCDTVTATYSATKVYHNTLKLFNSPRAAWFEVGGKGAKFMEGFGSIANRAACVSSILSGIVSSYDAVILFDKGKSGYDKAIDAYCGIAGGAGTLMIGYLGTASLIPVFGWILAGSAIAIGLGKLIYDWCNPTPKTEQIFYDYLEGFEAHKFYPIYEKLPTPESKATFPELMKEINQSARDIDFTDYFSWHSIIPLYKTGLFDLATIKKLCGQDQEADYFAMDDCSIELSRAAKQGSISEGIIKLYKTVSKPEDKYQLIDNKTYEQVALELMLGIYIPASTAINPMPENHKYMNDPLFTIPPRATGIADIAARTWVLTHLSTNPEQYDWELSDIIFDRPHEQNTSPNVLSGDVQPISKDCLKVEGYIYASVPHDDGNIYMPNGHPLSEVVLLFRHEGIVQR